MRGVPFGNPSFQYNRGRDEQPGPPPPDRNIGVGPWAYGNESVSQGSSIQGSSFQGGEESEEGTLVGSNISGAEPQRFGEQVYGGAQYAGGLAYDAGH